MQSKISNKLNKELSYKQSFIVTGIVLLLGFLLQWFTSGINPANFRFPVNVVLLLAISTFIFVGYFKFPNAGVVSWFSSTKVAIGSIVGFSVITLMMGLIPQVPSTNSIVNGLGLNNIAYSWQYVFSLIYLIFALGFATIKRIFPFHLKNSWYILNHLGLWIALTAANFGFVDQIHVRMKINDVAYSSFATDEKGQFYGLPFEILQTGFEKPANSADNVKLQMNVNDYKSIQPATISVNNPYKTKGWRIYFFDAPLGKNIKSNTAVIELIKEPWQPFVNTGLAMMIVGSFFVFWRGKKQ